MNETELLSAFRPTDADVEQAWPTPVRDALRARIVATPRGAVDGRRRDRAGWVGRHRRLVVVGAAASVVALIGGVVSVALPGGAPGAPDVAAAAVLERLAVVAGQQGGAVRPGQYDYTHVVETLKIDPQYGPKGLPGARQVGDLEQNARRQWVATDGTGWSNRGFGESSGCLRQFPSGIGLPVAEMTKLSGDATELAAYLDAHPTGDQRGSRSRFTIIGDLSRSGLAPPALRAAAIRVLAKTTGVEVRTGVVDMNGRPAIRVDFTERSRVKSWPLRRYASFTESLFFDPRTSRLLQEQVGRSGKPPDITSVVEESRIVDALPDLPICAGVPEG